MALAWESIEGEDLEQGDFIPNCLIPVFGDDFDPSAIPDGETLPVHLEEYNVIIVTQSCDLENGKVRRVALCPVVTLQEMEKSSPGFTTKSFPNVRAGRVHGLYLLKPFPEIYNLAGDHIVDFREIYALPIGYLKKHAVSLGSRLSLESPFREHFSSTARPK